MDFDDSPDEAEYRAHIAELKKNGQEGQLPRGIENTKEARERAYNLERSYNDDEHAGMEGMDHSTEPATEETGTEPAAEEEESEPASDGTEPETTPADEESTAPDTEGEPATSQPGGTS